LILEFFFTMVLDFYFVFFFSLWHINYNHAYQNTKSSTHSLLSWFWLKIFFPYLISWPCTCLCFTGVKLQRWIKNRLGNHL
jgi:hypothetical protein